MADMTDFQKWILVLVAAAIILGVGAYSCSTGSSSYTVSGSISTRATRSGGPTKTFVSYRFLGLPIGSGPLYSGCASPASLAALS